MAYTRQYTQGVGWENTPSINTPISAENLNQMDEAIQDVDAAVYTEFVAVYQAIENAGDARPMSDHIVSVGSDSPILNTSSTRIGGFKDWELLFLRCDVDAHYDSGWSGKWNIYAGGTTYIGGIVDNRDHYLDSNDFKEDIPAGSVLVLARYPAPWTVWALYAIIPAESGGGASTLATLSDTHIYSPSEGDVLKYSNNGYWVNAAGGDERPMSDHIVSVDSSSPKLNTSSTRIGNFKEWELFFLRCDVDAHYDSGWSGKWNIYAGGTTYIGGIVDNRDHYLDSNDFKEDIPAGSVLVLAHYPAPWTVWALYAIIPAASSGGGTHTDAINFKITSASSNTLVPVAFQRIAAPLNNGDLVFLYMSVNGTFDPEASATSWQLQYKLTDSTTITGSIANGLGSPSISTFNSNLPQGTWLVLKSGVYDSTTYTQGFTCIAKIDPASGGGTTVVANPTGTATDTLEKLQVGSTIYEIPGIDTAWAGKVTAVSGGNITPNNASFPFDPFTDGKFVILDIGVDAVKPGGVTSWSLQYTVDGNTVTRSIADKRDGNAYDPNFDDDLVSGSVIVLQYFGDNEFACVAVLNESGGGGASTLAGLSDTNIVSPTDQQYLKYDAASGKWVNVSATKTFVKATPNMAGYTTPSGVVSASSEYNGNYAAWYAFDGTYGNDIQTWASGAGLTTGEWIQYLFDSAKIIKKIATVNRNEGNPRAIKTFKFQGSNDGTTFTDIASCEITSGTAGYRQEFDINNDTAYLYYRLYVTEPWISGDLTVGLAELELFEEVEVEVAELDDLVDVDVNLSVLTDGQALVYDSVLGKWTNSKAVGVAGGGTGNSSGYVRIGQKENTSIGAHATAEGTNNTATGDDAHTEGYNNTASQPHTHAEGEQCQATEWWAHAEGFQSVASGRVSHAEGNATTASAYYAHSEGTATHAYGNSSHAEGDWTTASGTDSHAQNTNTTASGARSSAAGYYTTAGYENQFVVGKYNDNKSANIFEVGNGTDGNTRSNALELTATGNLKTAGTITDGNGNVLGQPVAVDGVWVISGETATLTVTTP